MFKIVLILVSCFFIPQSKAELNSFNNNTNSQSLTEKELELKPEFKKITQVSLQAENDLENTPNTELISKEIVVSDSVAVQQNQSEQANQTERFYLDKNLSGMQAFWKAAFEVKSFNDQNSSTAVISTKMYGDLEWTLGDNFLFKTQVVFIGRNGFTQSIYERSDHSSGLNLLESLFQWDVNSSLSLKFGNINQSFLEAPLLMADKTFPSMMVNYSLLNLYNFKPSILIQTAIPDNGRDVTNRESQIIKRLPFFAVGSFYLENQSFPILLQHKFFNRLTYFYYYNLPPAIAAGSRLYGNSVSGEGSGMTFDFNYHGLHNHTQFRISLSDLVGSEVGFEYINNVGAEGMSKDGFTDGSKINEAYRYYLGVYYNYSNLLEVKGLFEHFFNQKDSSVAYYNSELYGHNDRTGYLAKLQVYFYSSELVVGTSIVHSRPINPTVNTAKKPSTAIAIYLTTSYIKI